MSEHDAVLEDAPTPSGMSRAGRSTEVSTVLDRLMVQLRARAAAHGTAYELLWQQLERTVAGGKHFRGRLVVEAYARLGGVDSLAAARLGAAFELLHAGFLIHDDLIDHDTIRRGLPNLAAGMRTAAAEVGADEGAAQHFADASAVLAGDLAVALAHRLFAEVDAPAATRAGLSDLLWDTVFVSVAGELDDVAAGHGLWEVSAEKALSIAAEKTAFYSFQAPLRAAAVLAQAPAEVCEPLDVIGHSLGKAFQLADDLLGIFAPESVTGKSAVSDLREGKATTLILHARSLPVWPRIRDGVGRADLDEAGAAVLRRELARSGAPEKVGDQARAELATARQVLESAAALAPLAEVVMSVWTMVDRSLDDAAAYVSAVSGGGDEGAED
ncbi:polyprenyl synthetase family protein [Georgenia sunbinii]|uniref:polyprenyl synthetase family protein n=1 Tax=Georgenia sunbinii TaxID=3117728 RepID=UPI002F26CA6E